MHLKACFVVCYHIAPAANLHTGAAVGTFSVGRQRKVALAGSGHTEGPVGEHFYTDPLPRRAADVFGNDGLVDGLHLLQVQLPGQHHHIGPLRIETQGLYVGNAQLRGDMHLQADFPAVQDAGHVGGDDGIHPGGLGGVQRFVCCLEIFSEKGDIQRHIAADAICATDAHNFREVFPGEIIGRMGPHIQVADAEVHGIGAAFHSGGEATEVACRSHYLQFFPVHHLTRPTRESAKRLRLSKPSWSMEAAEALAMALSLSSPMASRAAWAMPTLS